MHPNAFCIHAIILLPNGTLTVIFPITKAHFLTLHRYPAIVAVIHARRRGPKPKTDSPVLTKIASFVPCSNSYATSGVFYRRLFEMTKFSLKADQNRSKLPKTVRVSGIWTRQLERVCSQWCNARWTRRQQPDAPSPTQAE